jgi:Ca2+-binding EF-hand superfamily protein
MRFWTKAVAMSLLGYFTIAMASAQTKSTTGDQPGKTLQPRFDSARFLKDHDKNSDGKLSKDELPAAAQKDFERLDANKDGFISQDELQKHAETMSHQRPELVEIFFYAIDIPEEPATTQELQAAYDQLRKLDKNHDGKIDEGEVKALREQRKKERLDNIFSALDRNKDGKISKDEARGLWSDNFAQIDKNGDGALDRQEIEAACAAEHSQHHKGQGQEQPNSKK